MGFLKQIYGEAVFIDTAPFIYFVEDKAPYAELLAPFYEALDNGDFRAFTSALSYAESLVVPLRTQNKNDIAKYEWLFSTQTPGLFIAPFELATAKKTAEIRANHTIKTPDAIQ